MLRQRYSKERNGLTKTKFLTYGVEGTALHVGQASGSTTSEQ